MERVNWSLPVLAALLLCVLGGVLLFSAHASPTQAPGWEGYAATHAKDPMLAIPGADLALSQAALRELRLSAAAAILPFSDDPSGSLHLEVYPYAYLEALFAAEDARRALASAPSKESDEAYHAALLSLMSSYDDALSAASSALRVGIPTKITSFGGSTSAPHIATLLEEGRSQLARMRAEEERRASCAEGSAQRCAQEPLWQTERSPREKELAFDGSGTLPPRIATMRAVMRAHGQGLGFPTGDSMTIELSQSSCYPSYRPVHYDVSTHPSQLSPVSAGRFTLLSDAFFYDLAKIRVRYSEALHAFGATYSYQPFNAYICQDSGREMGDLLAVRHAKRTLAQRPIIPAEPAALPALRRMLGAQNLFLAQEVPTHAAYLQLVEEIERLFASADEDYLTRALGTRAEMLRMRELALMARTRSAGFELTLGYLDDAQIASRTTGTFDGFRTNVFFMLRAGLSPLLLIANETGPFPPGTSLFSEKAIVELPPSGFALLSYERDLKDEHDLGKLLSVHRAAHVAIFSQTIAELIADRKRQ